MKNFACLLSIVGFSVLSGLFGLGATWLIAALFFVKNNDERLVKIMPVLYAGSAIGLLIGVAVALRVDRTGAKAAEAIVNKYVGVGGHMKIFFGAPIFVTVVGVMIFGETLFKKFGDNTGAYLGLGFFLFNIGISLYLYDRIPKAVIVPAGIIGWLLTLLLAAWYCFWGPGWRR